MDIECVPEKGKAEILMMEHIEEAIEAFPEDCSEPVKTPAASHMFKANENCPKLKERDRKILQNVVAKLLFVSGRARPDNKVPIAFLTSRVTKADKGRN
jgi:hypothetical protein